VVGYKSLIEADPNRPVVDLSQQTTPADGEPEKSAKGNRFFRAVGKMFHPAAKKEPAPVLLQPNQQ
jgi:hypothetical protein